VGCLSGLNLEEYLRQHYNADYERLVPRHASVTSRVTHGPYNGVDGTADGSDRVANLDGL
jgi:hypothetical protein